MSAIELPNLKDDGRFVGRRVGILCAGSPVAGNGGAERFYAGLRVGFESIGCEVDFVELEADEPSVEKIVRNYSLASEVDLSAYDLVVSSKVPTYAVKHPNHVLFLNHAVRIFDDMFEGRFPDPQLSDYEDRARIHRADYEALQGVKARMSQGFEISRRLMRWRGMTAQVLHPPLGFNEFVQSRGTGSYFMIAGRLHPWKRFDLLIKAVRLAKEPVRLLIAGEGEHETELRQLAKGLEGVEFLGRIGDAELCDRYSNAIAVPFIPQREDYGYVTLEAFGKATWRPDHRPAWANPVVHRQRAAAPGFATAFQSI